MSSSDQTPWMGKLRRVHAGVAQKAEWMAPDEVVQQVRKDYLEAVHWLQDSLLEEPGPQPHAAAAYLDGIYLKRYQTLFHQYYARGGPRVIGVLRADHQVQVRHFSEDGRRCVVIDCQSQRRMATYERKTGKRLHTQDLGDGAVVFQMVYDGHARRWKIEAFVQELPAGWGSSKTPKRVKLSFKLPTVIGRDN